MTDRSAVLAALGLSLALHGAAATVLWSTRLPLGRRTSTLPPAPLVVDLVEGVVAVSPRPRATPPRPRRVPALAPSVPATPPEPEAAPASPVVAAARPPTPPLSEPIAPHPVAPPPPPPVPPVAPAARPPAGSPAAGPAVAARAEAPGLESPAAVPSSAGESRAEAGTGRAPTVGDPPPVRPGDRIALAAEAPVAGEARGAAAAPLDLRPPATPPAGGGGLGPPADRVAALPREAPGAIPPEYDAYVQSLRQRIQAHLRYPWLAARRGLQGVVELEVRLSTEGRLAGVDVVGGAAAGLLREAALRAVRDAMPFPLPAGVDGRPLTIRLPVVFELR